MRKVILMGVPHHNNLGDSAIALAERQFIKANFPMEQYYEISEETLEKCIDKVREYVKEGDIIFLHGGGNLGDEYLYIEEARRKVIEIFPNNEIIIFPQTMHFSETDKGREELEKSKKIYGKHKKLTVVAREKVSYEEMKKQFKYNRVIQTTDMVTYLNETREEKKREGILLILRNDIERNLNPEQMSRLEQIIKKYFKKIEYNDTAKGEPIKENERKQKLEEMFAKYRQAQLVITDRLHGMIFAAITSTPCIAFKNYNHKIEATYETLKHLGYIKYAHNVEEVEKQIPYLLNTEFEEYNNDFAIKSLQKIVEGEKEIE